ncbi:uncharacterized protein (DUF2141 family) [Nonlabens xylanidelens]|uniref:Uncharacterized protein (DUF2141 family) n=1 Tax=Nonlabens xylanidelens TaxID=191564 RepID=A0A2S6IDW5_9FLAO|nr:DUF2141 domain-containing protein [Nonlabens xylanidelens]PPK92386.1 uncharacterized protein (DUF2141 family) [Nonlabens xylanidelens]PQJ19744.1 hypothetical protein BST94_05730 [Nonlabens xylanidelens]
MKTLFTTIIVLLFSLALSAQETFTLKVTVDNAKNDQGTMVYSLSTENQFMKAAPLQSATVEIKDGVAVAIFENIPAGEYAVMVLHDKNGNNQMDFTDQGMPKEAYGMSNNPMSYGPPSWDDAKITIESDKEIAVRL